MRTKRFRFMGDDGSTTTDGTTAAATPVTTTSTAPMTADQQSYLTSYQAQIAQFQSQLAALLPVLTKAQADLATAQFKFQTDQYGINSLLGQWNTAISTALPSQTGVNGAITGLYSAVIQNFVGLYGYSPAQITGILDNLADFTTYMNTNYGFNDWQSVYNIPSTSVPTILSAVYTAMPSTLMAALMQESTDYTAQANQQSAVNALLAQQTALENQINTFLTSAQQYQDIIGTIPTYQDLVTAATTPPPAPEPITASQQQLATTPAVVPTSVTVTASSPWLLYAGIAVVGIFLLSSGGKKS